MALIGITDWNTREEAERFFLEHEDATSMLRRLSLENFSLCDSFRFYSHHQDDKKLARKATIIMEASRTNYYRTRYSPLLSAIIRGKEDLAMFLLQREIPIDPDDNGAILFTAIARGLSQVIAAIIRSGQSVINTFVVDGIRVPFLEEGENVIWAHPDFAVSLEQEDVFEYLVEAGYWPSLATILASGNENICQRAFSAYPYVNENHRKENNQAIRAAAPILSAKQKYSFFRYLTLLNPHWTSLSVHEEMDKNPSFFCFFVGMPTMKQEGIEALLDNNGDVFLVDETGFSPFLLALTVEDYEALACFLARKIISIHEIRDKLIDFVVEISQHSSQGGNRQAIYYQKREKMNRILARRDLPLLPNYHFE